MDSVTVRTDHTVRLVDFMGSDSQICQAARVSNLGGAALDTGESLGLIRFLMRNRHGSPFEHGAMTFYIETPIFVVREFHRHRAGWSYNETSARYRELPAEFYVPSAERPLVQVGKTGAYEFRPGTKEQYCLMLEQKVSSYTAAWVSYRNQIKAGIAKEVARTDLPVGTYTAMFATCNPRSLMHFLSLRTRDPKSAFPSYPQYEIEELARLLEDQFRMLYPDTWTAFNENGRVAP